MAVFEDGIQAILGEGAALAAQRGGEYGDSWALENLVTTFTRSMFRLFGWPEPTTEQLRLVEMAALVDVKDGRLIGPYKDDSVIDGINYRAVLAHLVREYKAKDAKGPSNGPCGVGGVASTAGCAR